MLKNPLLRLLSKAGSVALLCVLAASFTGADPAPQTSTSSSAGPAQTNALRRLVREARSLRGPLAKKRLRGFGIRRHPRPSGIQRNIPRLSHADDQAIQDDTPAAESKADPQIALQAVGTFTPGAESPSSVHVLSPRTPRGPPIAADMFHGRRRFRQIEVADAGPSRRPEVGSRIRQ